MKPVLTIDEAIVLVAMPPPAVVGGTWRRTCACTDDYVYRQTNLDLKDISRILRSLSDVGLVSSCGADMPYWMLTETGYVRRTELLGFKQAVTTQIASAAKGSRFLAEADVKAGPSRAMYPSGRGT
jgi:hypothetical protein